MAEDAKIRLLICHDCGSIEELPWFEGPPEHDDTLNYRDAAHRFPSGTWHSRVLADVPKDQWEKPTYRDEIVRQIAIAAGAPGSGAGMGQSWYDVKANFEQDAIACWKAHKRTTDCGDYRAESKRLLPDTAADRRAEGLPSRARYLPNTWLCSFCPVQSLVTTKYREKRGDYDKKPWES